MDKETMILVDAHVHVYSCFNLNDLLDSAGKNFVTAAQQLGEDKVFTGVLLLTETINDNWYLQTHEQCEKDQPLVIEGSEWMLQSTPDRSVLLATKKNNSLQIYIIAGRQIVTAEGLELLALATDKTFQDGLSVTSALETVRASGAIPVFPWAVGKWLGKRGKLLAKLLSKETNDSLFLGDNGGRPVFWKNPSHFKQALTMNINILPGTDPLPFASQAKRVGSFGFCLRDTLRQDQPLADFKKLIHSTETSPQVYGRLENSLRFFINQIRLRLA